MCRGLRLESNRDLPSEDVCVLPVEEPSALVPAKLEAKALLVPVASLEDDTPPLLKLQAHVSLAAKA